MIISWRKSFVSRTLLLLACAVAAIILLATGVTYHLVFQAAEARSVAFLDHANTERAAGIELKCAEVAHNLHVVSDAFVARMQQPDPPELTDIWDNYFERTPDGALRSYEELCDPFKYASLWANKAIIPYPDTRRELLVMFEVCQRFITAWARSFRSLYGFTLDEMAMVGFDSTRPFWARRLPPDYDLSKDEIGMAASRAGNPSRKLTWTGARADPISNLSVISAVLPVEMGRHHVITVAHDMLVSGLLEETSFLGDQEVGHVIFGGNGRIIAQSPRHDFNGLYNNGIAGNKEDRISGFDALTDSYYAVCRIKGPEWFYATLIPRSALRGEAFDSARWVLWSGLGSLGLELLLLGVILRKNIERPVNALITATHRLAAGESGVELQTKRQDELGVLSRSFDEMARQVNQRDEALRHEKSVLEDRVNQRTAELRNSQQQLAGALEQEKELVRLKSSFVSLVSHEFRTPLEIITSSAFNLDRYHDRLSSEKRGEMLETIQKAVKRMAGMMGQVLFLGQMEPGQANFKPAPVDFESLCRNMIKEIEAATAHRCPIELRVENNLEGAFGDEPVLRHIFTNLLSNAVKYSPEGAVITLELSRAGESARCILTDRGCGIPRADQNRLFDAFHRGGNVANIPGTGLGLVIVKRCVEVHGGEISFESLEGQGTTFRITLPLYRS